MSKQIKGLLYYFITEIKYSLIIFWSTLLVFLLLSLGVSYIMRDLDNFVLWFGFPFATFIHAGIMGFSFVKNSIPFALKRGAIRKNIYIASGIYFFLYALFMATISSTLQSLMTAMTKNLHSISFLHPAMLIGNDTWYSRIFIDTLIIFAITVVLFFLGLLFYRGGLIVGGSAIGLIAFIIIFGGAEGFLIKFIMDLHHNIDLLFFVKVFCVGLVIYGLTYFLVRKITTVKAV